MRNHLPEANTLAALAALASSGLIPGGVAADLSETYTLLRRITFTLRRLENRSLSSIPSDPIAQRSLARRLGYPSPGAFLEDTAKFRKTAAQAVDELLKKPTTKYPRFPK